MKNKLVFLMLLSFGFMGCKGHDKYSPISKSQWGIFSFIPDDSQMVMFINLNNVRITEAWETFLNLILIKVVQSLGLMNKKRNRI